MNVCPVNENVLIKKCEEDLNNNTGLLITDTSKKKYQICEVVSSSSTKLKLEPKQKILVSKDIGINVEEFGKDYSIIKDYEIFAIIKD